MKMYKTTVYAVYYDWMFYTSSRKAVVVGDRGRNNQFVPSLISIYGFAKSSGKKQLSEYFRK